MAKTKSKTAASDRTRFLVRRVDVRRLLGEIPARTFANLEADGVIAPATRGTRGRASVYDLEMVVPAYVAYLMKQRPAMADREARALRDRTIADLNILRLRRESGELLPRQQAVTEIEAFAKAIAAMVRVLPRRLHQVGVVVDLAVVTEICRQIQEEVSRWRTFDDLAPVLEKARSA